MPKKSIPPKLCSIEGCNNVLKARSLCNKHYIRQNRNGGFPPREIVGCKRDYHTFTINGKRTSMHRIIAEKALGKPLPDGAEVHHVDGDGVNNTNSNLVICPSHAYHRLLHQRTRAYEACGNADWRKCYICKQYDPSNNLYISKKRAVHRDCFNMYRREWRERTSL